MNAVVRLDTEIEVELPGCAECNGPVPCPTCREAAIEAVMHALNGVWKGEALGDADADAVYVEVSETDVQEVRIE